MDDGMLIEQVSTFPQLYAKTDGRYKNNRLKENAWLTIAQLMDETPEACEHRWKILRNKYTGLKREIKNTPSGSGATQITWPYFKMMGFLDKYLQTRRSYSNIEGSKPESVEWNSVSQIIVEHDEEDVEMSRLYNQSGSQENEGLDITSDSISERSDSLKSCTSQIFTPKKIPAALKRPILNKSKENEAIPRYTIPAKKIKPAALTENISGSFETFNKVLEKNMTEQQSTNVDENFVRSLAADMNIFSNKEKIILKKKMYQVLCDHLEGTE